MQSMLFFNGKICRECKKEKPYNKFYKSDRGRYGRSSYCIKCEKDKQNRKYQPVEPTEKKCEICKSKFYSKYAAKYCNDCTPKKVKKSCRLYYFMCKNCSKLSITGFKNRQSYCSHNCYSISRGDYIFNHECITCGAEFKSSCTTAKYCSIKCRKRVSNIYNGNCIQCGNQFVSRYAKKYCSDKCSWNYNYKPTEVKIKRCVVCERTYKTTYSKKMFCSDICRDEAARLYKNERNTHRKRAVKFGVWYQSIDRFKVFKSNNYKCQDCGVHCLKSKIGTNNKREPTLDHIIPLSKGGPHSYNNVQTLCRECNNKKSNKLSGQVPILFNTPNFKLKS